MAEKKGLFMEDKYTSRSTEDFQSQQQEEYMVSTPRTKPERSPEQVRYQEQMNSFHGYQSNREKDDTYMDKPFFKDQRLYSDQRSPVTLSESQRDVGPAQSMNFSKSHIQLQHDQSRISDVPIKPPKEKKSISTKTFAHGLMDVSLLTTHATQLRTIITNKEHEFYNILIWMIAVSIVMQVLSGILLLASDFFKTQDKITDRQNQKKRKVLGFISLCIVVINTPLKILISAFYISQEPHAQVKAVPSFSPSSYSSFNHTEL